MDKIVTNFYRSYGNKVNLDRMIPLCIDGLKPVERRVLMSLYELAKNKFVKSAKICGNTLAKYHPHGDVYGTLVEIVKNGFAEGQGNWGCFTGIEKSPPAALRYTECKLEDTTKELCFSLIDYVPKITHDLEPEPEFIPTMFPMCLIKKSFTVGLGFGYKSVIPCYKIEDLYRRLLFLLGKSKFIPAPVTNCEITSDASETEKLLTTGQARITFRGKIFVDTDNFEVVVYSWPDNVSFSRVISRFQDEIQSGGISYTDYSAEKTRIVFKLRKRIDIQKFSQDLLQALTKNTNFHILVIDENKHVVTRSVDDLLLSTYKNFFKTTKIMLQSKISCLDEKIKEFDIILKIRQPLSKRIARKDISSKKDIQSLMAEISKDTKIPETDIQNVISKYKISRLLTIKTDTKQLDDERRKLCKNLEDLDSFVILKYHEQMQKIHD